MRTGLGCVGLLGWALLLVAGTGCSTSRPPELPDPDVDLGLGNIVVLTFTTRAPDGLLGHVAEPVPEPSVDPHRRAIKGTPRVVDNDQHLRVVLRLAEQVEGGAGYGPVGAGAQASQATHIAYDVRVTGYLEYAPADLIYDAESGCCQGGSVADVCGDGYVTRLFRGTGSTQLLSEVSTEAGVRAGEILRASGGKSFRRLSESSFVDSYFAYELSSLATLCERLPPDAEFAEMKVEGARNCFLTRFDARGERVRDAWTLPDAGLCAEVARRRCAEAPNTALRCEASYHVHEPDKRQASVIELEVQAAPASAAIAPAGQPAATAPAGAAPAAPPVPATATPPPAAGAPAPAAAKP